jgi:hypothetical protein
MHWRTLLTGRHALLLSLAAASVVWIGLLAHTWWQPIVADDVTAYQSAINWPNGPMRVNPPLYMYSVRLSMALFGQNIPSARIPAVLGGLATLFLIPAVSKLVMTTPEQSDWTATVAVWLYALSPLALQNMLVLGVDTSLLTPAMLGLVWLWLKCESLPRWQRIALLGLGLTVNLWIKLLSPILTMGSISLYYLLKGRWVRLIETVAATAFGSIVFWITYQIDLTSQYAFGYTGGYLGRLNILDSANRQFMAITFPQGMGILVFWLSIPIVILLGVAAIQSAQRWLRKQAGTMDALLLYAGLATLAYALVIYPAWGYPYYQTPFIPLLIIVSAQVLTPALARLSRPAWITLSVIAAGCLVFNLWVIGDPLLRLYLVTFETTTGQLGARLARGLMDSARIAAPISIALLIGFVLAPRLRVSRTTMLVGTLGALAVASLASTTLVQANARYSTRYRYGYNWDDMLRAAQRIREAVGPSGYVAAIDDVLFYTGLPGDGIYGMSTNMVTGSYMGKTSIGLLDLLRQHQVDALAWTTKDAVRSADLLRSPEMEHILNKCYSQESYGVFQVYLRKTQATCP